MCFLPLWFSGCLFKNDFWIGFWNHGLGTAGSAKWLFLSIFLHSATVSLLSQSHLASCRSLGSLPHPRAFLPLLCCVTTINIVLTVQQSDSLLSSKHELNNNPFNIGQRHYCWDGGSVKKILPLSKPYRPSALLACLLNYNWSVTIISVLASLWYTRKSVLDDAGYF